MQPDQPDGRALCGAFRPITGVVCALLAGHGGRHTPDGIEWWMQEGDRDAYARGLAEGRRQATEGPVMLTVAADLTDDEAAELKARFQQAMQRPAVMTVLPEAVEIRQREWAVRYPDGYVYDDVTEAAARDIATRYPHRVVVSRLVGPWEPDEQADPITAEVYAEHFPERDDAGKPLTAEEATPDCGVPNNPGGIFRPGTCKLPSGHPGWHEDGGLSWLRDREELERVVERNEHAPARRQDDPGALIEEPELYGEEADHA